jgi:hypothetical protein
LDSGREDGLMSSGVRDITASQLIKELREQGFKTERSSDGWLIENSDGQMYSFHESQIGKGINRSWINTLKELKNLGYNHDKAAVKREAKMERKRQPGHFLCTDPVCGCGREFPYAQNLGRHLSAVRERKIKDQLDVEMPPSHSETAKPIPPDEIRRARQLIKGLRTLSADALEFADLMEHTVQENIDMKRKMAKIEDLLGKTIDNL